MQSVINPVLCLDELNWNMQSESRSLTKVEVIQCGLSDVAVEVILTQVDQLIATDSFFCAKLETKERLQEVCTFQLRIMVHVGDAVMQGFHKILV